MVKRIEGFFSAPYDDNGALPGGTWTIGYGSIVDANGHPVNPATPPIAEAEAEKWLRRDMEGAARDVKLRVKVALLECEAAARISWTYNLGACNDVAIHAAARAAQQSVSHLKFRAVHLSNNRFSSCVMLSINTGGSNASSYFGP